MGDEWPEQLATTEPNVILYKILRGIVVGLLSMDCITLSHETLELGRVRRDCPWSTNRQLSIEGSTTRRLVGD